ncbi:MAG: hypothetical protein FJ100_07400 [Deltaproteobacteria bacterium]|nr:hypothetical protein [Deltaproteobacteria bacterium]
MVASCRGPGPEPPRPGRSPATVQPAAAATALQAPATAPTETQHLSEAATKQTEPPDIAADVTPTDDVLVWARTEKLARTWWLQGQGADWTLLAERDGIWSAGRDDVYGLREKVRRVRVCDPAACSDPEGGCVPVMVQSGPFAGRIHDAAWVGLLGERAVPIGARVADETAVALGSPGFLHRTVPVAQFDDLLLVEVVTETWSCGAMNGRTTHEPRRLGVSDGHLAVWVPGGGEAQVLDVDGKLAEQALRAQFPAADGPLRWQTVHLRIDAAHAWRAEHVFARDERTPAGFSLARRIAMTATSQFDDLADRLARAPDLRPILAVLVAGLADSKRSKAEAPEEPWFGYSRVTMRGTRLEAARQRFQCAKAAP